MNSRIEMEADLCFFDWKVTCIWLAAERVVNVEKRGIHRNAVDRIVITGLNKLVTVPFDVAPDLDVHTAIRTCIIAQGMNSTQEIREFRLVRNNGGQRNLRKVVIIHEKELSVAGADVLEIVGDVDCEGPGGSAFDD
jgi:hypothetical protein